MNCSRLVALGIAALLSLGSPAGAQAPAPSPAPATSPTAVPAAAPAATRKSPWSWSFVLRILPEYYDFFKASGTNENAYVYTGVRARADVVYKKADFEGRMQIQNVLLTGLPKGSLAPAPASTLGQGGTYFNIERRSSLDTLGIRQLFARLGGPKTSAIQAGRFEYTSGMEAVADDPVVAQVKLERASRKTIHTLNYNAWTRTFDGLRGDLETGPVRFTVLAMHPTQLEPHFATDVRSVFVSNVAVTLENNRKLLPHAEGQLYWIHYDDTREVPQVDNRPVRGQIRAEGGNHVDTFGFHYIQRLGRDGDVMAWYGHQSGKWGGLTQDANAFQIDGGLRFPHVPWKPMVRLGWSIYSGDGNPRDSKHGTFVTEVPDNRGYTPWWTTSNLNDVLGGLYMQPGPDTKVLIEGRRFKLDAAADLWYVGVGVTQQKGLNGYAGRPTGGSRDLGSQLDIAIEHKIDDHNKIAVRFEKYWGGRVVRNDFPLQTEGHLMFVEYHLTLP